VPPRPRCSLDLPALWGPLLLVVAGCGIGDAGVDGGPALTGPGDATPGAARPATCPLPLPVEPVVARGRTLSVGGRPFRALGANLYYLQQLFSYAAQKIDREGSEGEALRALDDAACLSFNVIRLWAFNDGPDPSAIRSAPGEYREAGLVGLDRAVAEARARGLRVILTLVNNWSDYGGLPAYGRWAGRERDDFFAPAGAEMRRYWKDHASRLAARVNTLTGVAYRDEPAILAVEVGNELRCSSCRGTTRLRDTVRELAAHLRRAFPRHLISDGGEGFDDDPALYPGLSSGYPVQGAEGASFSQLVALPELDLVSYHLHPTSWQLDSDGDARIWIERHQALAAAAGKVAYLGELSGRAAAPVDTVRAATFDRWLAQLIAAGGAMALPWQLVVDGRPDDGFGVQVGAHAPTAEALRRWARIAAGVP
jgi:mannan endo-1,4-beta-mannosidase